mgnify:CR=1 FL=1
MFQFYSSPIKTSEYLVGDPRRPSFNSTVVRLKLSEKGKMQLVEGSFNSTVVRLKQNRWIR